MATKYKPITQNNDVATTKTLLHEAIPLTGTIISGTYVSDGNIKNYSHGMFQSVYDYPYLSSSANHIFDITVGYSSKSTLSGAASLQNDKKINLYNQMAQILVGHDKTGSILQFDKAGDLTDAGTKMKEVIFVNCSRLLTKDEIKKESFTLTFLTGGTTGARNPGAGGAEYVLSDYGSSTTYKTNSPSGEYAILFSGSDAVADTGVGLLYYQAGIAVLTASIFSQSAELNAGASLAPIEFGPAGPNTIDTASIERVLTGSNITASCDGIRNAWKNLSFNNTTELNSTTMSLMIVLTLLIYLRAKFE